MADLEDREGDSTEMKYYQIKSTEKGSRPPRWYRTLVPSGITFSQLYVLLAFVHGEMPDDLSMYFEYETADREIYIEEFEDGKPSFRNSVRDIYDTRGTYIDTFFKKGFKISQYTGRDFDLTIEVEKDAEEYQYLNAPKVIKVSRILADEEGGQPEGETLPEELFKVITDKERSFRYSAELVNLFGRESIMRVSGDPVTPEESICKGSRSRSEETLREALQPLYEDAELRSLLEQLETDLDTKRSSDRHLMHRIDNLMLRKYGMTFGGYTLAAAIKGIDAGRELSPLLEEKPSKPAVTTEDFINSYSRKDLEIIADEYGLMLPANKSKKNLVRVMLQQMFSTEAIRNRLIQLEDSEMELFRLTAECEFGRVPETDEEEMTADDLVNELLAVPLRDDRLFITDIIRNVYEEADKDALETERQKSVWMYKCLEIARDFYGVMDWDVLGQLFARRFKGVGRDELKEVFRRTPEMYNDFEEVGDKLVLSYFIEDDYYIFLEGTIQKDKPFYIPSRQEIEEFWDKGCLLSSISHQAMYRYLLKTFGCSRREAELKVMEIYHAINNQLRLQEVIDILQDMAPDEGDDFVFGSQKDAEEFIKCYKEMHNHSHVMGNRGYPPHDLFNAMGGVRSLPGDMIISPRGPEAAAMLDGSREELAKRGIKIDEERIDSMLAGEKRKKTGRNDPCPCGSGKKYKNCCGKG